MKKNIGAALALYPSPLIVVGAMVEGKPTWTLVAHSLFEFPTYEYFVMGDKAGDCGKMNQ